MSEDMNTEIIALDTCPHPELVEMMAPWPDHGMMYQCSVCKKKIVIPSHTIMVIEKLEQVNETVAGIIGLAFGEQWENAVKRR